jgi:hypothetical protein
MLQTIDFDFEKFESVRKLFWNFSRNEMTTREKSIAMIERIGIKLAIIVICNVGNVWMEQD